MKLRIIVRPLLVSGILAHSDDGLLILIDEEQSEQEQEKAFWHELAHLLGFEKEEMAERFAFFLAGKFPNLMLRLKELQ